jgi:glycine dehydrogenase
MLQQVGASSLDDLMDATVPAGIRLDQPMNLPDGCSEHESLALLKELADQNQVSRSMIGAGYYGTIVPPVIQRNVLENPGWYTAYTPYQAEISQGRLESLLTFQQMVMDLSGMSFANASLLDEATAAAEAMALCKRAGKHPSTKFFVAEDVHPQTLDVIQTRATWFGYEVIVGAADELAEHDVFGALLQYPGTEGRIVDLEPLIAAAHENKALVAVASDLLALTLLKPPGEMDADIVIGSAQRFGVPMGLGGPHAAFLATRDKFKRSVPGRVIGVSKDVRGNRALRMAMQTREQHIRRDKATSNICTAQALLANMATFYAIYHGPGRLKQIASRVHSLAVTLAKSLENSQLQVLHSSFFDTVCVKVENADQVLAAAAAAGINLRKIDNQKVGISLDETSTERDVHDVVAAIAGRKCEINLHSAATSLSIPTELQRSSDFLTHEVFHRFQSETEMLRYLKRLENRDYSLTHGMIPLGSCTMKLNATSEMIPVTWPGFSDIHPFAPAEQWQGYQKLIDQLKQWLTEITGYDAVSLQPNSGAQGEYAGLLAIRRYHESIGQGHRDVCLIPVSAHGTNPASASMMGMKVVVVQTDEDGNIDLEDLKSKIESHADSLSTLMITYPSTHGVFEETVQEVCELVHRAGGQVYLDGANLNALVGIAAPGKFGADVSHLNLHKTFCIPHGGGGPGVGPIGVRKHLTEFLPRHRHHSPAGEFNHAVAAAPYGSASILPISWAYIRMMGTAGLTRATQIAILNANYIAARLNGHYEVLYRGRNERVAHECIVDIRPIKDSCGISEKDLAKRLMDYGFHAPTMSWPVAGTIMIEPTESESLAELDRFCDAMIQIRDEIRDVESGRVSAEDSALQHAPHTMADLVDAGWDRVYSREFAVFPTASTRTSKFWPTVNRVDDVYGDRNVVCACPPMSEYETDE